MTDVLIDDSLVRWSVPVDRVADALATRPLLLLMHGYGSFEGDLIELAPLLPDYFVCASPRAPLVAPAPVENGYAWFQIGDPGNPSLAEGDASVAAVLAWLDALAAHIPGGLPRVALMGFSQGGAMVTHLLRTLPARFLAGVNCSGFILSGDKPGDVELARRQPPVFWGRDVGDPIVTGEAIRRTAEWLPTHSTLTTRLYPGIQHSISREELGDISAFLAETVPAKATPESER
ncbi:alpha/beta hydrolase [Klugiella xanthotipulae]|uniref:Phospholipase/carboxylesterase n=1 Tax=Klugiella xanthotipulae TaxID=244735 RepID=A0A543I5F4_9MICO|nr:alpha/beta fold hydrolase [Klugiella xanthotipulae]TQM65798.1 phospholipase/carboxylesterase [Klugiella xanthotipulae]